MKKITVAFFTLIFILALGCRKEKPQFDLSDKDPCGCASEVSAEFTIEERATHIPEEIWDETDTTNWDSMVRFTATEQDAQYTWYIGSQVFNTKSVSRFFSEEWKENDISITLVVNKQPNLTCFPDDDGYDSITKTFHVSKYPIIDIPNHEIYHPIEGTYRVYGPSVEDSIDLFFNVKNGELHKPTFEIDNFDGHNTECLEDGTAKPINFFSFNRINFGSWNGGNSVCSGVAGEILINQQNTAIIKIQVKYALSINSIFEFNYNFRGRKIN